MGRFQGPSCKSSFEHCSTWCPNEFITMQANILLAKVDWYAGPWLHHASLLSWSWAALFSFSFLAAKSLHKLVIIVLVSVRQESIWWTGWTKVLVTFSRSSKSPIGSFLCPNLGSGWIPCLCQENQSKLAFCICPGVGQSVIQLMAWSSALGDISSGGVTSLGMESESLLGLVTSLLGEGTQGI